MSSDTEDHGVLLFGGLSYGGGATDSQTWLFSGGVWSQQHPQHSPVSCLGSAMSDDPTDGYVVYVGGLNETAAGATCPSSGETWVYQLGDWTQLHPASSPPAVGMAAFANTSAGPLIFYGGQSATVPGVVSNATWSFSGGAWTQLLPTTDPGPRWGSGMTYDAADGYLLLYGGGGFSGKPGNYAYPLAWLTDTWKFQSGTWTDLNIAYSPPEPFLDGLNYDPSSSSALYTNAYDTNYSGVGEALWSYSAGVWTEKDLGFNRSSTWPIQRIGEGAAFDWSAGDFVLFGGTDTQFYPKDDTWTYSQGSWTNATVGASTALPAPRYAGGFAYDAADGYDVLFGGYGPASYGPYWPFNDTWKFTSAGWTLLHTNQSPPARYNPQLVYDASDGYLLLFGGVNGSKSYNDTWEFTNGGWTQITPRASPPASSTWTVGAVYDSADGYVLLVDAAGFQTFTWAFHAGVWTNLTAKGARGPPGPFATALVDDSEDGYVLGTGTAYPVGTNSEGIHADSWRFLNGNWTNITGQVANPLPPILQATAVDDPAAGYVVLYGGSTLVTGNTLNTTYAYVNGTWSRPYTPVTLPSRYYPSATYDPGLKAVLVFGGLSEDATYAGCSRGLNAWCNDLWMWSPSAFTQPVVESFTAGGAGTDVGIAVHLAAQVAGGSAPYTYAYAGLPPGCLSANTSDLSCRPTATGTFQITLTATDTNGIPALASISFVVSPALTIGTFAALPPTVEIGGRTLLSVQTTGGTTPVSYAYSGLPAGCASQTVPTLPCLPSATGLYPIAVNATDAVGSWSLATLLLNVTSVGGTTGFRITQFSVSPPAIVLGNSTTIAITTAGNTSAVSYAIVGLPPGCSGGTANGSQFALACFPTASGTYGLTLQAADGSQSPLSVGTNLTVYPAGGGGGLEIVGFAPTPGALVQGNSTVLNVTVQGGSGPLRFDYFGLPLGCASQNTSRLACQPMANGTFSIQVVVQDAAGNRAGAFGHLEVQPPGTRYVPPPSVGASSSLGAAWWEASWFVIGLGAMVGGITSWGIASWWAKRQRERREGEEIVRALNDEAPERDLH